MGHPLAQPGSISQQAMINKKEKQDFARKLRKFPTYCEARLAKSLKAAGVNFDFNPIIYGFIPDFYFPKARLIVEIDGSVHNLEHVKENDKKKDAAFKYGGLQVKRFTNQRVLNELGDVVREICEAIGHKRVMPKFRDEKYRKGKRNGKKFKGWSAYRLDPVRRFNPGENKTLYVPPKEKEKHPIKIKRIIRQ